MSRLPHRIILGGVVIDGTSPVEDVTFSDLTGWYGVPDARGSVDPIPGGHGSFKRVDVWRESLAVSIAGSLHTLSRDAAERRRDELTAVWEAADTITVVDETGSWSTAAEVERVTFQDRGAWSPEIPFTIDLIAPDPVRYSELLTVGPVGLPVREGGLVLPSAFPWNFGTATRPVATVANPGSLPILPRMILQGAADGVTVHGGPWRVSYGTFAGTLVFDSLERRAWLNGVDVTRQVIRRDWPVVDPGVSSDFYFVATAPSPDLALTVEYRIGVW